MFGGINVPFIPFLSLTVVNTVHLTPRSQLYTVQLYSFDFTLPQFRVCQT